MDMPPSRYRVVERGRRLIVVDSHTGAPVTGLDREQQARIDALKQRMAEPRPQREVRAPARVVSEPRPVPPPRPSSSSPTDSIDPRVLTTRPWFDDKAPRRVRIAEGGQSRFGVFAIIAFFAVMVVYVMFDWPVLVVIAVLLLNTRKAIRAGITRWLDGMEQA